MRDIRGDLQDRASFLKEQLSAAQAQFEKRQEQLKREHEARIEDLQSEFEAVTTLMELEYQRLTDAPVQDEPRQAPPVAERHPVREAEPDRRPAPEAEYQRRQEQEPYRQANGRATEPQRRPSREPAQYRAPHAAEAVPQRRPGPVPVRQEQVQERVHERVQERAHEDEGEQRSAAPQIYRRAPLAAAPAREGEHEQPRPAERVSQAPQQPPLADFLIRKLSELGAMTFEDLCHIAVQEGYFANGDVDRGVHVTLTNVVKAGFIRQQPDGTFSPATVMDTIRLRRAI
jgi:hypothetical protein